MATRLKTVEFGLDALAAVTSGTVTNFTQITIYLPEAPTGAAFKKVIVSIHADDATATPGNVTARTIGARVAAIAYTTVTNANTYTGSGESIGLFHAADFTSHFSTNWSGTSMTFDCQVTLTESGTTPAWRNVSGIVSITYEYDDTSATQIKTVYIPLNAPVGTMALSKPGSPTATIPNLSTELPEASKVFRQSFIVVQGNINNTGLGTTDTTMSLQLDTTSARTTGAWECGQTSDRYVRYTWDCTSVLNTAASMGFYIWGQVATGFNHMQAYLAVTYAFDATAANDTFVSIMLPMEMDSPMGGTTSSDYQRATRELFIQEPGSITTKQIAFFAFWEQAAAIAGLNMRIGTGSFVAYTDGAAAMCGSNACMVRNDAAFTLARGRNTLNFDVYRTDTTDFGWCISGFWIVNYTAGKPSQGYGAANHTVKWNLGNLFSSAAATAELILAATAPSIPETSYYLTAVGANYQYITNTTGTATGVSVQVERLAGEGGIKWENAYRDSVHTDPETGLRMVFAQVKDLFKRWPGDLDSTRMDIETSRRWKMVLNSSTVSFHNLDLLITYHTITYTVSGTVSGSAGGTVTLELLRDTTGEKVLSTTRSGDGAFSFTWYDNTENVYVCSREDSAHIGRSERGLAGT